MLTSMLSLRRAVRNRTSLGFCRSLTNISCKLRQTWTFWSSNQIHTWKLQICLSLLRNARKFWILTSHPSILISRAKICKKSIWTPFIMKLLAGDDLSGVSVEHCRRKVQDSILMMANRWTFHPIWGSNQQKMYHRSQTEMWRIWETSF